MADEVVVIENKKPWFSKTILIGSILGLVSALSPFVPFLLPVKDFINSHAIEISTLWGLLTVALRFISKGAISLQD